MMNIMKRHTPNDDRESKLLLKTSIRAPVQQIKCSEREVKRIDFCKKSNRLCAFNVRRLIMLPVVRSRPPTKRSILSQEKLSSSKPRRHKVAKYKQVCLKVHFPLC